MELCVLPSESEFTKTLEPVAPYSARQRKNPRMSNRRINSLGQTWPRPPNTARSDNPRMRYTESKVDEPPGPRLFDAPIDPQSAIEQFSNELTEHEKSEILDYPEIYYISTTSWQKRLHSESSDPFDTFDHLYRIIFSDHIAYRYQICKILKKNSDGHYLKCYDHKNNKYVAIKVLANTPKMQLLADQFNENISKIPNAGIHHLAQLHESFVFRNHHFFVFDFMSRCFARCAKDMHFTAPYGHTLTFPPLENYKIRIISNQLLNGLLYLHKNGICHGNLTTSNVFFIAQTPDRIKLIDYGFGFGKQPLPYQSPEVLLDLPCGPPSDVWSFGCILSELVTGRALFPGRDEKELMALHVDLLGRPPVEITSKSPVYKVIFSKNTQDNMNRKLGIYRIGGQLHLPGATHLRVNAADARREDDVLLNDLIKRCLEWWPSKRISVDEARRHPWFSATETKTWKKSCNLLPTLTLRV